MAVEIAEGIAGVWHYHLRDTAKNTTQSLCGRPVMRTAIPLQAWGVRTHLKERWCEECAKHLPASQ